MSRKNRRYKARVKRRQKLDKQRMKAELKLQKLEEKEERKRKKVMEKEERHRRKQEKREQKKGKKKPSVHGRPVKSGRERNRGLPQDQRRRSRKKRNRKKSGSQRRKPLLTVKWGVMVSAVCRIGRILRPFGFMISIISLRRMRTRTLFLKTGVIFSNYFDSTIHFQLSFINHKSSMTELNRLFVSSLSMMPLMMCVWNMRRC